MSAFNLFIQYMMLPCSQALAHLPTVHLFHSLCREGGRECSEICCSKLQTASACRIGVLAHKLQEKCFLCRGPDALRRSCLPFALQRGCWPALAGLIAPCWPAAGVRGCNTRWYCMHACCKVLGCQVHCLRQNALLYLHFRATFVSQWYPK